MKKVLFTLRLLLFTLFLLLPARLIQAQNTPTPHTLLWKISGKGLQTPAYLFGTIHMLCESDFHIPQKVTKSLYSCNQLVLETDISDTSAMQQMMQALLSDTAISQKLSPTVYSQLDSAVQAQTGISIKQFDQYKLSSLFAIVTVMSVKCPAKQYETELVKLAQARHMRQGKLEEVMEQVDYINKGFTDAYCVDQLIHTDMSGQFAELTKAYLAEDVDALYKMMREGDPDEAATKLMLDARNDNWIKRMPSIMGKGGAFFAVGAMHLVGPHGVVALLKKEGYVLTPVM
jgi:uncharacterized protein